MLEKGVTLTINHNATLTPKVRLAMGRFHITSNDYVVNDATCRYAASWCTAASNKRIVFASFRGVSPFVFTIVSSKLQEMSLLNQDANEPSLGWMTRHCLRPRMNCEDLANAERSSRRCFLIFILIGYRGGDGPTARIGSRDQQFAASLSVPLNLRTKRP